MSITGIWAAANTGIEAGQIVSGFIFNYTKSEYEQKISTVKSLITELENHLSDMTALQNEIHKFWQDDNAQKVYQELMATINHTKNQMATAKNYLDSLQTVVSELDSSNVKVQETLDDIQKILNLGMSL